MNDFITTHTLDFEMADSPYNVIGYNDGHKMFRVGTCEGQWGVLNDSYYILAIINSVKGNGHFNDVLQWFEYSCKMDDKNLLILECMNKNFYSHLISKRGFIALDKNNENCIKVFNRAKYKWLKKEGNEILMKGSLKCI